MATVTSEELKAYQDRRGYLRVQGMTVEVTINYARISYGAVQLEITPVSGSGSQWVDRGSVMLISVEEEAK
jgi:hypothetical protein